MRRATPVLPRSPRRRWASGSVLPAVVGLLAGCVGGGNDGGEGTRVETAAPAEPSMRAIDLGDATGLVEAGAAAGLVAYVSRAERRVYLDRDWRGRVHFLLGAYTSVSTGLWRIPLPGDAPLRPIAPGDESREFEVTDLDAMPPELEPVPGDMRVRLGAPETVRLEASCPAGEGAGGTPEAPGLLGGPWTLARLDGPPGTGGREEFVPVGTGQRTDPADCTPGETVDVLTWVAVEPG